MSGDEEDDLLTVVRVGELDEVQEILATGRQDICQVNERGASALHYAAANGNGRTPRSKRKCIVCSFCSLCSDFARFAAVLASRQAGHHQRVG